MKAEDFEKATKLKGEIEFNRNEIATIDCILERCCSLRCVIAGTLRKYTIDKQHKSTNSDLIKQLLESDKNKLVNENIELQKQFDALL